MSSFEWHPAPPTTAQRWIAGSYLAMLAFLLANSHFDWLLLGPYNSQASIVWTLVGLVLTRFLPTARRSNGS